MALAAGQTLDRYTIEALVGEGGMGRVYRAFDARLQRCVALKVLRVPAAAESGNGAADVLREARAAAAIAHPNATAVFDAGEFEGRSFIAMEYVPGISLRALIGAPEVPLTTRLRWLVDIAGALAAAHQVGVIHRDIKPENVIVRDDGLVKVLDFGVAGRARLLDSAGGSSALGMVTPSGGNAVGTPAYMAPEQLRGVAIDGRADQFGWGVLAYELLTGRLPWREAGDFMAYLVAVLTEEIDAPSCREPAIPEPVDAAILRALAKSPGERFPTMAAAAAALAPHAGAALTPAPMVTIAQSPRANSLVPASPGSDPTVDVSTVLSALPPVAVGPPSSPRSRHVSAPPPPSSSLFPPSSSRHSPPSSPPSSPSSHRPLPPSSSGRPPPPSSGQPPPASSRRPPLSPPLPSRVQPPTWNRSLGPELDPILDPAARATFVSRIPPARPSRPGELIATELRPPRTGAPVDLDDHLRRVPNGATIKGMFFLELQRVAEGCGVWAQALRAAGLPERRYFAFRDYPMVDNLRLTFAVATHVHPRLPVGDAIRRLGETAFDVVLASQIGRAVFGVLGRDVEPLLLRGPKAFKLLIGAGDITAEKTAYRTYQFRARNFPAFLETYQIGVLEGVLRHCGERARLLMALEDVANATLIVEII